MNPELTHLEELERMAEGKMSAQELSDFRQRLATDQALLEEYELFQTLRAGIKSFHRKRLFAQMAQYETRYNQTAVPFYQKTIFRQIGVAATVALVLAAGIVTWNKQSHKKDNWQASLIDDPGLPVLMSNDKNAYNQAMNFYRQGAFKEALHILPANNTDTTAFYKGIFWLKLQKPDSAYHYLSPLRHQNASVFRQKAEYYSAMALWQEGKKAKAKSAFEKITKEPEHPFHDISAEILKSSF